MDNNEQKILKLINEYTGQHNYTDQINYILKNCEQQNNTLTIVNLIINKLTSNGYIKLTDKKEYKTTIGCDGTITKSEIAHLNNIYILTELGNKSIA